MVIESEVRRWESPLLQDIWKANAAARAALLQEVRGLTDAQLAFRSAAAAWSVGEILDHLCLSERSITRTVSRLLQQAAGLRQIGNPGSMDPPPSGIDLAIYERPAQAPDSVLPSPGRPLERLLADLEQSRERMQEVTARADGQVVGNVTIFHFQLGELGFYQWLALEGAHETRHLEQIRRIKTHPDFPRA